MNFLNDAESLKQLQNLLSSNDDQNSSSDSDEERETPKLKAAHSDDHRSADKEKKKKSFYSKLTSSNDEPKTLEEFDERESLLTAETFENRKVPEHRIVYKQSVATEDIYLRLGNRTPATASCEQMCIEIDLPEETVGIDKMSVSIIRSSIDVQTPIYHLNLPLIHPIDPNKGKAIWNADKKMLKVVLHVQRELDFINF